MDIKPKIDVISFDTSEEIEVSQEMEVRSGAYFDPDFDSLFDRILQPRVCIDNDTSEAYTLVKVDSANRHGILLEMVQLLTDLDLVISKSYISSDAGWLMDVFHVTDQLGNKLTDPSLIRYIQQSLVAEREGAGRAPEAMTCLGKLVGPGHLASEYTALEVTATDQPGLLSEISAVLAELDCYVVSCQSWTHNRRSAVIMYIVEESTGKPISDPDRLAHVEEQVGSVVGAHLGEGDQLWRVRLSGPDPGRIHTERRLHQLMHEDRDYEGGPSPRPVEGDQFSTRTAVIEARKRGSSLLAMETQVSIDSWKEREYSIVNVRSRDRPKLLFDTVCTLTDMQYLVFHAAVSSHGPLAIQEYYIRHMDGRTFLDTENERRSVTRCLVAAVERRVSHGLRVEVSTRNRKGLLSDVTRVLREGGLSLTRAECTARGERAVGTFYVTDASSSSGGGDVDPKRMELVRKELGEGVALEVSSSRPGWPPVKIVGGGNSGSNTSQMAAEAADATGRSISSSRMEEERPKVSLGSLLWSHIGRFSSNLGSIRS